MSYACSLSFPDEVTISGNLGTDDKELSFVFHGIMTVPNFTSTQLLTQMLAEMTGAAPSLQSFLSVNWVFTRLRCRQIRGWKYRYGNPARFSITLGAGGVITAIGVGSAGSGYPPSSTLLNTVYDFGSPAGSGAVVTVTTNSFGQVSGVSVLFGGIGYVAPVVDLEPPPAPPGKENNQSLDYAAQDALTAGGLAGAIAGDSAPSFNAFSTQLNTTGPGREAKGHNHMPDVPEASTLQNGYQAGVQALVQASMADWFVTPFIVPIATAGRWQAQVFSRKIFFQGDPAPLLISEPVIYPITSVIVNPLVGSEVRRKQKN